MESILNNKSMIEEDGLKNIHAHLIGLGEVAHGTGGLHALAAGAILYFIEHRGVRTIFLESPADGVLPLNEKIKHGNQISAKDIGGLYGIWQSGEVLTFLNLVAKINQASGTTPVEIIGIDTRQPSLSLRTLISLGAQDGLRDLFQEIEVEPTLQSFREIEDSIYSKKQQLPADFLTRFDVIIKNLTAHPLWNSEKEQMVSRLRFWISDYQIIAKDIRRAYEIRDMGMAEIVKHELSKSAAPAILWAHLAHLTYENPNVQTGYDDITGLSLMGTYLKQHLGSDYQVVGLSAKKLTFTENGSVRTLSTHPNSVESFTKKPLTYVDLEKTKGPNLVGSADRMRERESIVDSYLSLRFMNSQMAGILVIDESQPKSPLL